MSADPKEVVGVPSHWPEYKYPALYLHGQNLCDGSDLAPWPVATGQGAWRCRPLPLRLQPWVSSGIFATVTHDRTVA